MKTFLLLCFSVISISASAQFLGFGKRERFSLLQVVPDNSLKRLPKNNAWQPQTVVFENVAVSEYDLGLSENIVMRTAQHNMRFRVYDLASYNFNELANIYVTQNRFSEAKWYFLQSNSISRRSSNDKLTIANLISLAEVKSQIGDFKLALEDLNEARQMAAGHGWQDEMAKINQKQKLVEGRRSQPVKTELRYAGNVTATVAAVN